MRRRYVAGGAVVVLTMAVLAIVRGSLVTAGGILPYDDPQAVAQGEKLYAENCAQCHGTSLAGEPDWRQRDAEGYLPAPPHDATGHTWHHPDELLVAITTLGSAQVVGDGYRSRMPGFGDSLSPGEILAVLAYVKSTWPAEVIDRHNQINAGQGH